MKKSISPRKKYLNGSNSGGVTPNGIPSPAATLNDYQIMMAKAEQEAANNEWLPVVAAVGGLVQQGVSAYGSRTVKPKAANGMNDVEKDVEVEGGERFETPQGETGEFKGPSHEEGGIPMEVNKDIPQGTKVYSDRLKVGDKTLADRKATRDRQIANLEKIATQPLVDSAMKNATKRKMAAIQKEEAADLAFQEQINNMQQMADTVVKAFGTSVEGVQENPVGKSMRYANGTSAKGVTEYGWGSTDDGISPSYTTPGFVEGMGLDSENGYGVDNEGNVTNGTSTTNTVAPILEEPANPPGTVFSRFLKKGGEYLDKSGVPGVGDLTGLFGDYLGATSGLKNAEAQRASDVTHQNVFANAGKDAQGYLDKSMTSIEGMKTAAEMKATTATRGAKVSANNSARGVNQKRGMNWLYDQGLAENIASISANAANQVADIYKTKATTSLSADQLKGEGQLKAEMANEAAKDAYYTAKGLGLKDQALGVQNIGKDINAVKKNKMMEKLLKSGYGKWTGLDSEMNTVNKNGITKEEGTGDKVEIPDGKGGKISVSKADYQKLMDKLTNTK